MSWLLRDDTVLASTEVFTDPFHRVSWWRLSTGEATLVLTGGRILVSVGAPNETMAIFCDKNLVVIDSTILAPNRVSKPRLSSRWVILCSPRVGLKWDLKVGDQLELRI